MKKKFFTGMVVGLMLAVFAACGATTLPETGDGAQGVSGMTAEPAEGTAAATEESKPVYPSVNFDEEFTVAVGERVQLAEGVIFVLKEVKPVEATNLLRSVFVITDGEEEYSGIYFTQPDGTDPDFVRMNYNPYTVVMTDLKDKKGTFRVSDRLPSPEPMEVSGKAEDVYTTEDYAYLKGERCVLFLDKDVTFKGNIMEDLDRFVAAVEKESGMSYSPNNRYGDQSAYGIRELYYGLDPWPGVEEDHTIPCFYVVVDREGKGLLSCSLFLAQVIVYDSLDFDEEPITDFTHELSHGIQGRNDVQLENKMSEGFAEYMGLRAAKSLEGYIAIGETEAGLLRQFPEKLNASTAEGLFLQEFNDYVGDYRNYQFGYYVVTYLYETYGEDAFKTFLAGVNERVAIGESVPLELEAEVLKECFSETFFEDFGAWFVENQHRL